MILKVQKLQLLLSLAYYVTAEVANMAAAPKRKWLLSFDLRSAARRSHPTLGRVTALDRKKIFVTVVKRGIDAVPPCIVYLLYSMAH
jgi:hypothetical protein